MFDGDGQRGKTTRTTIVNGTPFTQVTYYVRSTVLGGQVVTEMTGTGGKQRTFVYAGAQVLAWQNIVLGAEDLIWEHRDPSNASFRTTNENGSINDQTTFGDYAPAELDPAGADARVFDPYLFEPPPPENTGSLLPYPSFGDASRLGTTYSWDGIPIPADEFFQMLNRQLHGPLGIVDWLAQDSANDANYRPRPDDDGGTALPNSSPWLVDWTSIVDPQNTGFLIGRFGFNANETERLGRAYDKIISDACRKFFDETLARMKQSGEIHSQYNTTPSTLAGVMAITTLNRYSSNLTATAVGISQQRWGDIRNKFESGAAAGVTLGGDGRVFLGDNAFYQPGSIAQMFYKAGDLPGIIVHEFFHRAGLTESQVKALNPQIQKNCGNPQDAL